MAANHVTFERRSSEKLFGGRVPGGVLSHPQQTLAKEQSVGLQLLEQRMGNFADRTP